MEHLSVLFSCASCISWLTLAAFSHRFVDWNRWEAAMSPLIRQSAAIAVCVVFINLGYRAEPNDAPTRVRPQSLQFTIVRHDNGEPVADAKVVVRMFDKKANLRNLSKELASDAQGH